MVLEGGIFSALFKRIVIFVFCSLALFGSGLIIYTLITYAIKSEHNLNIALLIIGIVGTASPIITFIISIVFKYCFKINFFDFDFERIKKKKRKKAKKKYSKLIQ